MSKSDIFQLLNELFSDESDHDYKAIRIPDVIGVYIAINRSKQPVLLVKSNDSGNPLQLKTDILSLFLNSKGTVYIQGDTIKIEKFHMLQCESSESATIET